jgi:hypothetical protein
MHKITFTQVGNFHIELEYHPKPSKKVLPDWYKNQKPYFSDKPKEIINGDKTSTIKKCMPVFDALTSGYVIVTHEEISIEKTTDGLVVSQASNNFSFDFHHKRQLVNLPYASNGLGVPKFLNPWSIKTPKGYSCLFINPVHGSNSYFNIFEGIVDTDEYVNPVNFPFILKDSNFEGIIPAGTPLVQIIPFKRDEWQMQKGDQIDQQQVVKNLSKLKTVFYEGYKKFFWSSKSFD